MDPAVFEKLGAAVSDPEIQKKISAYITSHQLEHNII